MVFLLFLFFTANIFAMEIVSTQAEMVVTQEDKDHYRAIQKIIARAQAYIAKSPCAQNRLTESSWHQGHATCQGIILGIWQSGNSRDSAQEYSLRTPFGCTPLFKMMPYVIPLNLNEQFPNVRFREMVAGHLQRHEKKCHMSRLPCGYMGCYYLKNINAIVKEIDGILLPDAIESSDPTYIYEQWEDRIAMNQKLQAIATVLANEKK